MSNCITVSEIYQIQKEAKQDKSKYYNVILEKCYNKIRHAIKYKKWHIKSNQSAIKINIK